MARRGEIYNGLLRSDFSRECRGFVTKSLLQKNIISASPRLCGKLNTLDNSYVARM